VSVIQCMGLGSTLGRNEVQMGQDRNQQNGRSCAAKVMCVCVDWRARIGEIIDVAVCVCVRVEDIRGNVEGNKIALTQVLSVTCYLY
jgi:hypothetical protein